MEDRRMMDITCWTDGVDVCVVCVQTYAYEFERRCSECDCPLCPLCADEVVAGVGARVTRVTRVTAAQIAQMSGAASPDGASVTAADVYITAGAPATVLCPGCLAEASPSGDGGAGDVAGGHAGVRGEARR